MIFVSIKENIHTVKIKTYLFFPCENGKREWYETFRDIDPRHVESIRSISYEDIPNAKSMIYTFYLEKIPVDMDLLDLRDLLAEFGGNFKVEKE